MLAIGVSPALDSLHTMILQELACIGEGTMKGNEGLALGEVCCILMGKLQGCLISVNCIYTLSSIL